MIACSAVSLAAWVFASTAPATVPPRPITLFPRTSFALPAGQGIKMDWVLAPMDTGKDWKGRTSSEMRFDVDPKGNPWFGEASRRLFMSPVQSINFLTQGVWDDFVFLDGGDHLVCTDKYLGTPMLSKGDVPKEAGMPVLRLTALMKLEHPGCRLFSGGTNTVYILVHNKGNGMDEVTQLVSGAGGPAHADKIIGTKSPIGALAGDGRTVYFSLGRWIMELQPGAKKAKPYFRAKEPVTGLAYSAKTGLFYATSSRVGFVSPDFHMDFLTSPNPQLALRGTNLYVRLNKTLGVIRISGADRFQHVRWAKR